MRKKYTLFHFSTGDFKGVERYLNQQAARGWELETVGLLLGRWRRTDRAGLTWCVDLANPKQAREDREDYLALCGEGGWELVGMTNGMYLFKSMPERKAIPVQTDPVLERKNYNRYYIKDMIRSAIALLAYLGVYALMLWSLDRDWAGGMRSFLQSLRYSWFDSWIMTVLLLLLPVWGLAVMWRLANVVWAMIRVRDGKLKAPMPWLMWGNGIVGAVVMVSFGLVLAMVGLDFFLSGMDSISLIVILVVYAGYALYKALELEKELFSGERRNYLRFGVGMAIVVAALIAAAALTPYGEWSSYGNDKTALAKYVTTETAPLVRTDDLGLPLDDADEGLGFFDLRHTLTPAGERWEIENHYWTDGLWTSGCETYQTVFAWQAERLVLAKIAEMKWSAGDNDLYTMPGVELEPVALEWADEAWYGGFSWSDGNNMGSVLVLRKGTLVCRLSAPVELMTEELLSVIRTRLGL